MQSEHSDNYYDAINKYKKKYKNLDCPKSDVVAC